MINSFSEEYMFLSNFYPIRIEYEDFSYPSVEHAYQAAKSMIPLERWSIANCKTAAEAKKMGRLIHMRPDWEDVKLAIMGQLLLLKFANTSLRQKLLDTGDEFLVEENYWGDTYWGVCRGVGYNYLGQLLMSTRDYYNESKSNYKSNVKE